MTTTDYTIALAAALKAEQLTHALYNMLASIARAQSLRGYASTPQIAIDLGVTFNSIQIHLGKTPDLFTVSRCETRTPDGTLRRITLTPDAIKLLSSIKKHVDSYISSAKSNLSKVELEKQEKPSN